LGKAFSAFLLNARFISPARESSELLKGRDITPRQGFLSFPLEYSIHITGKGEFRAHRISHLVLGSSTNMKFTKCKGQAMLHARGACLCPNLRDSLTSTREPLHLFRDSTPAENRTTRMLVSCMMQAMTQNCRSVLGNGHHHRILLLSVTLHRHNVGKPEIQGTPQILSLQLRSQHPSSRDNSGHDASIPASKHEQGAQPIFAWVARQSAFPRRWLSRPFRGIDRDRSWAESCWNVLSACDGGSTVVMLAEGWLRVSGS
jgi:hypothetical protein